MPEPKSIMSMIWFNSCPEVSHMSHTMHSPVIQAQENMTAFIAFLSVHPELHIIYDGGKKINSGCPNCSSFHF